jgi:hypothetical protein
LAIDKPELMEPLLRAGDILKRLDPAYADIVARLARIDQEPRPELTELYCRLQHDRQ